jgi:hypothetical protein
MGDDCKGAPPRHLGGKRRTGLRFGSDGKVGHGGSVWQGKSTESRAFRAMLI